MTLWTSVRSARQGQARQARQGQREARTASTAREQVLSRMLELWKARSLLEGYLEQKGPDQKRCFKEKETNNTNTVDAHNLRLDKANKQRARS